MGFLGGPREHFEQFYADFGIQLGAEKPPGSDLKANKKCIGKRFVTRTASEPKTSWPPTLSREDIGPLEGTIGMGKPIPITIGT